MAVHATFRIGSGPEAEWTPVRIAAFSRLRVLAWRNDLLYACRGYTVLRARIEPSAGGVEWEQVGKHHPVWWRTLSSSFRLSSRLFRDGFHALAALSSGHLIGAVPGAIVTLPPEENEFRVAYRVLRGTRPLHIAVTPSDHAFWGEYFDNRQRDEVRVYGSTDRGSHWDVAYAFARGTIRHVHNIVYDEWENCFWMLTGDTGSECQIIQSSSDFKNVDVVLSGSQQVRAAALVPTADGLYFSTDTPFENNHIYRLDRSGNLAEVAVLNSSSTYGCRVGDAIFFSTMAEPSKVNSTRDVGLYGSPDGVRWQELRRWNKDRWPMGLFQYGNAFLPDGCNTTDLLAITTVAVEHADLETTIWRV
jgi:hypothetical protein